MTQKQVSELTGIKIRTIVLLDKFEENDVKFISYSENFDTSSPIGKLVFQLMASIAEMERNTLNLLNSANHTSLLY
ncbi:MAG: hin 4 [Bacillus sp. (in: firmicutes)]|jgi:site-specific DNA recombinase|nr:hin 4 [Bacillus sp. (in: firmicutes)]